MFNRTPVLTACGAAILGLVMSASGYAWDARSNHLTFSGSVALQGVTLARGTYIFELSSPTNLNVVRVLSRDRSRVYLTTLTIPIQRPADMRAHRLVTFGEAKAGEPMPITAWYPAGHSTGHQFAHR